MALIITEGIQPSDDGQGYLLTPGIHTQAHIAGWQEVTSAVHAAGGRIVVQLMHVGRISHPGNTPHHRRPVAPSAVRPQGAMFTAPGLQDMPTPRALPTDEVAGVVDEFRRAASVVIAAGFDGVEIHGANGYLIHQFLSSNADQRTDRQGGSIDNRIRFATEDASAVADEIGAERTGLRISPGNPYNDMVEHDTRDLHSALLAAVAPLGLAYLHVIHGGDDDSGDAVRHPEAVSGPTTTSLSFVPCPGDRSWGPERVPVDDFYRPTVVERLTQSAFLWDNFTANVILKIGGADFSDAAGFVCVLDFVLMLQAARVILREDTLAAHTP